MITLAYAGATQTLSDRLIWTDEYAWTPVVTETHWGTNGSMQVHVGVRQAGRPITLNGQSGNAWMPRAQVEQLNAWAALPGAEFDLLLRGQTRTVLFAEFTANAVWAVTDGEHTGELLYLPSFKFTEI
jgi:hypothetical protein